jgi:hypothetical protein
MKSIKRLAVLFVLIVFTVAAILWLNSSNDKKELTNNKSKRKICADGLIPTS